MKINIPHLVIRTSFKNPPALNGHSLLTTEEGMKLQKKLVKVPMPVANVYLSHSFIHIALPRAIKIPAFVS